jgi:hypothetical protein
MDRGFDPAASINRYCRSFARKGGTIQFSPSRKGRIASAEMKPIPRSITAIPMGPPQARAARSGFLAGDDVPVAV